MELCNLDFQHLTFISLEVVFEYINLILLGSPQVYQSHTTNKSYIIGNNNAGVYITLHCLAL